MVIKLYGTTALIQGSFQVVIYVYDDDDGIFTTLNEDEFVDQFNLTSQTDQTSLQGRYGKCAWGGNHLLPCVPSFAAHTFYSMDSCNKGRGL